MNDYQEEVWTPVVFEDTVSKRYTISSYGRVWCNVNNSFISPVIAGVPKYWYVNMNRGCGKRVLRRVHRIMGMSFIPNPHNLPAVDHIDRNRYNNSLCNLRWLSNKDNNINRDYIGTVFKGLPLAEYCSKNFSRCARAEAHIRKQLAIGLLTEDEILSGYFEGGVIEYQGETVSRDEFLKEQGIPHSKLKTLLKKGLTPEQIGMGYINVLSVVKSSSSPIEMPVVEGGAVCVYFPSKKSLADTLGLKGKQPLAQRELVCSTYEDYVNYKPRKRETEKHELNGSVGSVAELSVEIGVSTSVIRRMLGKVKNYHVPREIPNKRYYICDGVIRNKKWALSHYLPDVSYSNASSNMNRLKLGMLDLLVWYDIDISELDIITKDPYDVQQG